MSPTAHAATPLPPLPSPTEQADRLIALGLHAVAGLSADEVRGAARSAPTADSLLVVHPDRLRPSDLAPMLWLGEHAGFIVEDMTDVDDFAPIAGAEPPRTPLYLLSGLDRGDAMAGWSPDEALPALTGTGRTPLTLVEGMHWVLHQPDALDRNHCFMTIGSRRRKSGGRLDTRTPALWISNGTGRDGRARRDAPKVGWCWAGNRHTWLGFASALDRVPMQPTNEPAQA